MLNLDLFIFFIFQSLAELISALENLMPLAVISSEGVMKAIRTAYTDAVQSIFTQIFETLSNVRKVVMILYILDFKLLIAKKFICVRSIIDINIKRTFRRKNVLLSSGFPNLGSEPPGGSRDLKKG